jgi:hypothetical protein
MRAIVLSLGLTVAFAIALYADDRNVDFDHHLDFSTLKSFALHEGKVNSPSPEVNNPLLVRKLGDAIRAALVAKGLRESAANPDLIVDYSIATEEFSAQRGGPTAFTLGTLVIDFTKRDPKTLVWRGVYRDKEGSHAKLAQALPRDVAKSLEEYPPHQKGAVTPAPPVTQATPRDITPKSAASQAIEIIRSTRQHTGLVSSADHPGLNVRFNELERAAQTVVDDDGTRPAATEDRISRFYRVLKDTGEFATSIANRTSEGSDSRARARELAEKLRSLVGP